VRACITPPSIVGEHEFGELAAIERARQPRRSRVETRCDRLGPRVEISGDRLAHRRIGLVQLEGEAADRATVRAVGLDDALTVAGEEREDPCDRVVDALPRRSEEHRADASAIASRTASSRSCLPGKKW
jgi:hypothetical protein